MFCRELSQKLFPWGEVVSSYKRGQSLAPSVDRGPRPKIPGARQVFRNGDGHFERARAARKKLDRHAAGKS